MKQTSFGETLFIPNGGNRGEDASEGKTREACLQKPLDFQDGSTEEEEGGGRERVWGGGIIWGVFRHVFLAQGERFPAVWQGYFFKKSKRLSCSSFIEL